MSFALTMYNARGDERVMVQETRAITADELLRMPDDGYQYELVAGRLRKMQRSVATMGNGVRPHFHVGFQPKRKWGLTPFRCNGTFATDC